MRRHNSPWTLGSALGAIAAAALFVLFLGAEDAYGAGLELVPALQGTISKKQIGIRPSSHTDQVLIVLNEQPATGITLGQYCNADHWQKNVHIDRYMGKAAKQQLPPAAECVYVFCRLNKQFVKDRALDCRKVSSMLNTEANGATWKLPVATSHRKHVVQLVEAITTDTPASSAQKPKPPVLVPGPGKLGWTFE